MRKGAAPTFRWRCHWARDCARHAVLALALTVSACVAHPPSVSEPESPGPPQVAEPEIPSLPWPGQSETPVESLLGLIDEVLEATSAEQRASIEHDEQARFEATPTDANLLRLTMVRALSAALPSELRKARTDLAALADGTLDLSNYQRSLALMALALVDQRLRMGTQITRLQKQIDSLTEIEASLKDNDVGTAPEASQ